MMKATSAAAAAILLAAHEVSGGYHDYLPAFFRRPTTIGHRRSLASQQCLDETGAYFADDSPALSAFDLVNDEIADRATCDGVALGRSTCAVDFATFDSAETFAKSCTDLGGRTVGATATIDCGYAVPQIRASDQIAVDGFAFTYGNLVDCVSSECEEEGVRGKIDGAVAGAASKLEESMDVTCSYAVEDFVLSSVEADPAEEDPVDADPVEEDPVDADATDAAEADTVEGDTPEDAAEGETVEIGVGGALDAVPGDGAADDGEPPAVADVLAVGEGDKEVVKDLDEAKSSAQCRGLVSAAVGISLLNMVFAV